MNEGLQAKCDELLSVRNISLLSPTNPIQTKLGLRLLTVHLAILAVKSIDYDNFTKYQKTSTINFTLNQQKLFAHFQIYCNKWLEKNNYSPLPLYHLTPSMILDIDVDTSMNEFSNELSENNYDIIPNEDQHNNSKIIRKQKKKKKNKNKGIKPIDINIENNLEEIHSSLNLIENDNTIEEICVDKSISNIEEVTDCIQTNNLDIKNNDLSDSQINSLMKEITISKTSKDRIKELIINNTSNYTILNEIIQIYEKELSLIRDNHEETLRSLHLRLYITETSLIHEKEKYNSLIQTSIINNFQTKEQQIDHII